MDKKKLIIILLVVLAGGGYAAKTMLLPKPAVAKPKIDGTIYVLPKGFTFNLTDGRYATMTIGLILGAGQSDGASAAGRHDHPGGHRHAAGGAGDPGDHHQRHHQPELSGAADRLRPGASQAADPERDHTHDRREGDRHPVHRRRGPVTEALR